MIPGTEIEACGQKWVVPALSLRQLRDHHEMSSEHLENAVEIIRAGMRRRYPEMTAPQIEDVLQAILRLAFRT